MIGNDDFDVFFNTQDFGHQVTYEHEGETHTFNGIFANPAALAEVSGGGYIDASTPTVSCKASDTVHLKVKSIISVDGQQWKLVKPPEKDGTGMAKLILGQSDDEQSKSKLNLRY
ncbi:head-tail joining protein [Vibrio sp. T11.5]|uniref:head-tail joining protein n=1 Tax=Vibrio sp. T11.5 TaxID=2998836 RepID=UPI0022CD7D44|nr:hypothetical protein [Vibrio sp. T11.5]MDA0118531.1 hypothetical protein [Vibrio sp. T11.5]